MKKLLVILLLAFFTVGISSCAEDFTETDPIVPEVTTDSIDNVTSGVDRTKRRARKVVSRGGN